MDYKKIKNYLDINQANWDDRAKIHFVSEDYAVENFINDPEKLSFEAEEHLEIGDVKNKTILHLMCHIGLDTLSFARLGAIPTGVDFSSEAINYAEVIKRKTNLNATFIQSDIYELPEKLDGQFDIVFTSIGVLCWLPNLKKWAKIVAHFLKQGGMFYIKDNHPFGNIFEYSDDKGLYIAYPYSCSEPQKFEEEYSYAGKMKLKNKEHYEWQHSLSELVNAITDAGLTIETITEDYYLTFQRFPIMQRISEKKWILPKPYHGKVPLMFSLKARK